MLRDRQPQIPRLLVATFLFGLIWWVPARKGIFVVS
jgi:hypothetical protein